jgi:hypothetical protein
MLVPFGTKVVDTEVAIPASMSGTISDRIGLNIDAETVKSLAPSR